VQQSSSVVQASRSNVQVGQYLLDTHALVSVVSNKWQQPFGQSLSCVHIEEQWLTA
jgi:hypothetical protein